MDDCSLDETLERVLKIDQVVRQLDESIRLPAFELLARMYIGRVDTLGRIARAHRTLQKDTGTLMMKGLETFAATHGIADRPAHNVLVLAAWWHLHQPAEQALTPQVLRTLAACAGLPVPRRPDGTLRYARQDRKPLFVRHERGWLLTETGRICIERQFPLPAHEGTTI